MQAKEILKGLDLLVPLGFDKLITLSDLIGHLEGYVLDSRNYESAFEIIKLYRLLLKIQIQPCMFVPCVDWIPIKKPKTTCTHGSCYCVEGIELCDIAQERQEAKEIYDRSQQNVLFEGWQESTELYGNEIVLKNKDYILFPNTNTSFYLTTACYFPYGHIQHYKEVFTLYDLAEATIDNPIKFKKPWKQEF